MFSLRKYAAFLVLIALLVFRDLKQDLDSAMRDYGLFSSQVSGADVGANILVGLFKQEEDGLAIANYRTVSAGEPFNMLVPRANYTVFAFSDVNGDFTYQAGEPAARVDSPFVNWFDEMHIEERLDYDSLQVEEIELTSSTALELELEFSLASIGGDAAFSERLLRQVSWGDEIFSPENGQRGLWEPIWFKEEIGYGLYVLDDYDPTRKSILLVHGITDTPRVFESLANAIPADYQLLLFYYPSGFPLEFTANALNEVLDELVRRGQIAQLDIIAHSMGGLVSKGMLQHANATLRERLRLFISIASPFGGHASASIGTTWSPVVAPVWWAMVPGSEYLQMTDALDLINGPNHHLIFSFSHDTDGKSQGDDGVVTVKSQLTGSAQRNATAVYGIADSHAGVVSNSCTAALVTAILNDGSKRAIIPDC
jgi:pimeloyl-ACP methyl ester carboxylesterase